MALLERNNYKIQCDHCIQVRGYRPIAEMPGSSATMTDLAALKALANAKGWRQLSDQSWACTKCLSYSAEHDVDLAPSCPFANIPDPTLQERLDSLRLDHFFWTTAYYKLWDIVCELPVDFLKSQHSLRGCFDFDDFADRMFREMPSSQSDVDGDSMEAIHKVLLENKGM